MPRAISTTSCDCGCRRLVLLRISKISSCIHLSILHGHNVSIKDAFQLAVSSQILCTVHMLKGEGGAGAGGIQNFNIDDRVNILRCTLPQLGTHVQSIRFLPAPCHISSPENTCSASEPKTSHQTKQAQHSTKTCAFASVQRTTQYKQTAIPGSQQSKARNIAISSDQPRSEARSRLQSLKVRGTQTSDLQGEEDHASATAQGHTQHSENAPDPIPSQQGSLGCYTRGSSPS